MAFKKGQSGNPKGKPPGPNKKTAEFQETVRKLLEDNSENVGRWLALVAEGDGETVKPDPGKALDLLAKLAEFAAPKLSRSEVKAKVENTGLPVIQIVQAGEPANP